MGFVDQINAVNVGVKSRKTPKLYLGAALSLPVLHIHILMPLAVMLLRYVIYEIT